jgi:hypothetical protein
MKNGDKSQVTSVQIDEQRLNLGLIFASGQMLSLIGDEPYECYTVQKDGKHIIV